MAFECWATLMANGCFSEAWRFNDLCCTHWPSAHRLWNGEEIQNSCLNIRSLHGLGDAVQMLRYVPALRRLGCDIAIDAPAALQPLLPFFDGVSKSITQDFSQETTVGHRIEFEMMELPYFFRTEIMQLPLAVRYLSLPQTVLKRQHASMGVSDKKRVGIIWSGGDWDRERWISPSLLNPLFTQECFEWWNLQGGSASAEVSHPSVRFTSNLSDGGLIDLAATMVNLDLILTIDSLAAHLAGALGVPTWLMLKYQADWRWMHERGDSPWYPSIRIFRQPRSKDWNAVVEAVQQALERE